MRSIAEARLKLHNPINTMKDEIDSETTEFRRTRIQSKSAHAKSIVEMQAVKPSSRDQSCITTYQPRCTRAISVQLQPGLVRS